MAGLQKSHNGLLIDDPAFAGADSQGQPLWDLLQMDRNRWLLISKKSLVDMGVPEAGVARVGADLLAALLVGMVRKQFSGVVIIDVGRGVKRIFFENGEIVFAASNLIDDRLGEVIYRAGKISLEEMTESTVRVNRSTKFGKVLLQSKVFTLCDLWSALKLQVSEILTSVFLVDEVYLQIKYGAGFAPSSLLFEQGSEVLIDECSSFGGMFREFVRRIDLNGEILVNEQDGWEQPKDGTFDGDMYQLIKTHKVVKDVVARSKLTDINTFVTLLRLTIQNAYSIPSAQRDVFAAPVKRHVQKIKNAVELYQIVHRAVVRSFQEEGGQLPVRELQSFLHSLEAKETGAVSLTDQGELSREGIINLYAKGKDSAGRAASLEMILGSLTKFLVQISEDSLPREKAHLIKRQYQEMNYQL